MASIMLAWTSRTPNDALVHHPGNNDLGQDPPNTAGRRSVLALAALASVALAAGAQEDPGYFEVRSASVELEPGSEVYFLNAWLEFRLSTEAREALESGVPLSIRLEVELLNRRRFWVDTETAELTQLYQLQYHALPDRYTVRNLNSGDQASFATVFSALNYLGRIDGLPLIDRALLDPDRRYDLRLRALLDTEQLPGPLRLLAFWRRDWSLRSEWYRWSLEDE